MKAKKSLSLQSGQIVVEYVLLLTIAVTLGMIIVSQLIKKDASDPANSGALIKKWNDMQQAVGKDVPN